MTEPIFKSFQLYDCYGTRDCAVNVAQKLGAEVIEVRDRYGAIECYAVGFDCNDEVSND